MLQYLASFHPLAPYLLGPLVAWVLVWCWRTYWPDSFERLPASLQSLPAVLISAIAAASSASEAREVLIHGIVGAVLGLTAVGGHHALKAAPGPYGRKTKAQQLESERMLLKMLGKDRDGTS